MAVKKQSPRSGLCHEALQTHYFQQLGRQNRNPAVNLNVRGTPVMLPMLL